MQQIGKDEREELDMEPAKYWVNHHIYPQYACSDCTNQIDESTSEVKSAPNNALIPKSLSAQGFLPIFLFLNLKITFLFTVWSEYFPACK